MVASRRITTSKPNLFICRYQISIADCLVRFKSETTVSSLKGIFYSIALRKISTSKQRMKLIMDEQVEVRDLYRLAAVSELQIRSLNYKRDSLEDIFLKAME